LSDRPAEGQKSKPVHSSGKTATRSGKLAGLPVGDADCVVIDTVVVAVVVAADVEPETLEVGHRMAVWIQFRMLAPTVFPVIGVVRQVLIWAFVGDPSARVQSPTCVSTDRPSKDDRALQACGSVTRHDGSEILAVAEVDEADVGTDPVAD
jgi:hypothetical protein